MAARKLDETPRYVVPKIRFRSKIPCKIQMTLDSFLLLNRNVRQSRGWTDINAETVRTEIIGDAMPLRINIAVEDLP
jgi:hypothetical protein